MPSFGQRFWYALRSFSITVTPFKWWGHVRSVSIFTQHRLQLGPIRLEYWRLPTNEEIEKRMAEL